MLEQLVAGHIRSARELARPVRPPSPRTVRKVESRILHEIPPGALARILVDADDGFLAGTRFLLDCDPLYTAAFRELLGSAGITPIRLPPSSPHFVRFIKGECLGKLVLLGEKHLRTAVREYVVHYHTERNQQGLDGRLIEPPATAVGVGQIVCR